MYSVGAARVLFPSRTETILRSIIMRRSPVHKGRSARKFRGQVGRTKVANMRGPMRGGFRF